MIRNIARIVHVLIPLLFVCSGAVAGEGFTVPTEYSKNDGPNCHNAALRTVGFFDSWRFVPSTEFNFWLQNFCEEVPSYSSILPMDLRVVKRVRESKRIDYWHTQIFLDNDTVFEKVGAARWERFQVVAHQQVGRSSKGGASLNDKVRTKECNWADGDALDCYLFANHYRCSPESYFALIHNQEKNISKELGENFMDDLKNLELKVSEFIIRYSLNSELEALSDEAGFLMKKIESLSQDPNSKMDRLLLDSLRWRVTGIIQQTNFGVLEIGRGPQDQVL